MSKREQRDRLTQLARDEAIALDGVIASWTASRRATGRHIFCAAGCSNCCTLFVQATLPEALIVAEKLTARQFRKLEDYIVRQRQCFAGESEFLTILRKQRTTLGPCPFVDDAGHCSIYMQRPLACRALLSTKDPAWCGADFSTLDPLGKRLYLESLEREIVAYPVHYVASTQETAQNAETRILDQMRSQLGTAISGNFPLLVYLVYSNDFPVQLKDDALQWQKHWQASSLFHPLLLTLTSPRPD